MKQKNVIWEYTEILIVALILAMIIRAFFVQAFKIPSGSMMETLQEGDYLLVTRFNYDIKVPFTDISIFGTGDPQHGDIIVFRYPKDPSVNYIKRVIGLPGDTIEIKNKQVFRNGKPIKEPYTRFSKPWSNIPGADTMGRVTVPPDHLFCMGDNRDDSADSREWGFVPRENIQGKAWVIYWSWQSLTDIRWGRIGTFLYPDESITSQ
ncbi:Signal peptidase I [uncultured delta proteobacterium]|uniref:Signal peptidase I n=1 Tax=uncultured delta proteobacterium TaxID=34034 RepID=A0A212JJK0_9DELT|nr:Signal peptidase I [uncultured delta proteobacterium]